jgi:hypothetical protein
MRVERAQSASTMGWGNTLELVSKSAVEVVVAAGATLRIDAGSTVDPQHRASPAKGSKAGRLIHARVRQTSKAAGAAGAVSGGVDVLV